MVVFSLRSKDKMLRWSPAVSSRLACILVSGLLPLSLVVIRGVLVFPPTNSKC